jgi:hypothetical protein
MSSAEPKRMTVITKERALKIRDKLGGVPITTKNDVHDMYGVFHNGRLIAQFGIRRGSKKEAGHDHVQKELNVPTGFAKQISNCTRYLQDYLDHLHAQGLLPTEQAEPEQ